jgi:hypothetical protein
MILAFFTLDFIKKHFRYQFLVKGDVCIAFDRKDESLKVIGVKGCATIPLTKTMEQQIREQVEAQMAKKVKSGLLNKPVTPDEDEAEE